MGQENIIWALDNGGRLASRFGRFNMVTTGPRLAEWKNTFGVSVGNRTPVAQTAATYYTQSPCLTQLITLRN